MKIGIISDTHRDLSFINSLNKIFKDVELIIHLGDNVKDGEEISNYFKCDVIGVKGNCDFTNKVPKEIIKVINNKRILITHGDRYGVKSTYSMLLEHAIQKNIDIVLFGHTHCSMIQHMNGILFVNPGSPTFPRDWVRSVAVMNLEDNKVNVSIKNI